MVKEIGKRPAQITIEISEEEILKRISQIEDLDIEDDLREFLIQALRALVRLDQVVGMKDTTIARLRKIFGKKIEKKDKPRPERPKKHPRGNNNGRTGKKDYPGAPTVQHECTDLNKGDRCPECYLGNLYEWEPGIYIRITGSAPLSAVIHETQKLRCGACGKIFEAEFEGKNAPKYDEKAKAIIALLKYKASVPFYRLAKIQKQLYTPMPPSTQWDLMEQLANILISVWKALISIAPEGNLFHQDDTKGKVLELFKENQYRTKSDKKARKGIYTSGILSELSDGKKVILYFTGRKYSGENLTGILRERKSTSVPIVMSDALPSNKIKEREVLETFCNAHGRRKFFDLGKKFEEESKYILDRLEIVYKTDKEAKTKNMCPKKRLELHQEKSKTAIDELEEWFGKAFEKKIVEPNSQLGKSVKYMNKHWHGLTEFMRTPGVPLDNNVLERKLRLPVLNRKNWYFYKTEVGALVGDIIVSVVETAAEAGVNIFDYLVWLQKNKEDVKQNSEKYLPWNFKPEDMIN
ncbi:MAG: IS66 family transposase [Candidatus Brocadiales bacterium]|nr:IS66 family transposase [Candidatus Brocadiales bacterium]